MRCSSTLKGSNKLYNHLACKTGREPKAVCSVFADELQLTWCCGWQFSTDRWRRHPSRRWRSCYGRCLQATCRATSTMSSCDFQLTATTLLWSYDNSSSSELTYDFRRLRILCLCSV